MFKSEAEFLRRIAAASLTDCNEAYDAYQELDSDLAHTGIQLIKGRMEALLSFLDALEFPETPAVQTGAAPTILMEKAPAATEIVLGPLPTPLSGQR